MVVPQPVAGNPKMAGNIRSKGDQSPSPRSASSMMRVRCTIASAPPVRPRQWTSRAACRSRHRPQAVHPEHVKYLTRGVLHVRHSGLSRTKRTRSLLFRHIALPSCCSSHRYPGRNDGVGNGSRIVGPAEQDGPHPQGRNAVEEPPKAACGAPRRDQLDATPTAASPRTRTEDAIALARCLLNLRAVAPSADTPRGRCCQNLGSTSSRAQWPAWNR